ncbi:Sec23/Sec24 trunk domain family protein [Babesia bovis T2Bo]|uniref:Uncharacterized protein n=1 Tax=Babesia bovis TaxID=5865 RepID=A7AQW5_BABBO|nr:Sec23/Sec24 trunk domain family protein [Babesia bovis T2Bo]EDO06934.1 Sec23/Sec24 trunk domain family protein [Babesia bovis T2Bo]|eukprot:XP_001610502.1 hypothetical protein [Babesia bovis T2Bo]
MDTGGSNQTPRPSGHVDNRASKGHHMRKRGHISHHAMVHRKLMSANSGNITLVRDDSGHSDVTVPLPNVIQPPLKATQSPITKVTGPTSGLKMLQVPSSNDSQRRRRTISSGSDYSADEIEYVDRELEKIVYTYGPITSTKIDHRHVPRPQTNVEEPESEVKPTKPVTPLLPTYQPAENELPPMCEKTYVSLTMNEIPIYGDTLRRINIPFAVVVQPFAEEVKERIPMVDLVSAIGECELSKQNLIRCPKCQAYFNPAMELDARLDYRICNFCYTGFTLTEPESRALAELKAEVSKNCPVAPVMQPSVDFIAPVRYYIQNLEDDGTLTSQLSSLMVRANELSYKLPILRNRSEDNSNVVYYTYSSVSSKSPNRSTSGSSSPTSVSTAGMMSDSCTISSPMRMMGLNHDIPEDPTWPQIMPTTQINTLPSYVIAIDTTSTSRSIGLKNCVLEALRPVFQTCQDMQRTVRFCVITYDCVVHLYDRRNGFFSVNVVSEVDELFSPGCFEELFVEFTGNNIEEVLEYLDNITKVSIPPTGSLSCGNFALSVAISLLADAHLSGTVSIFYAQPPELGLGHCEKPSLTTEFSVDETMKIVYDGMILQCYENAIAVDVYICAAQERMPADIPLMYMSQQTAGWGAYFSSFNPIECGPKIMHSFTRLFTVPHAYNCELKLRTSKPIYILGSFCSFHNMRSYIDKSTMKVPRLSPDTAICFHLYVDDLVSDRRQLYVQFACMYNSSITGKKLIRVHTQSVKVSTNIHNIFKNVCADTIINYYAKKLVYEMIRSNKNTKQKVTNEVVLFLANYRKLCAPSTPENQLILPENIKSILCLLNALMKIINLGEQGAEFLTKMLRILQAPIQETIYLYSRCYCLHRSVYDNKESTMDGGWDFYCAPIPSTVTQIYSDGIYLIDDGQKLVLYFGPHVKWPLLQELFGQDLLLDEKTSNKLEVRTDTETGRNMLDAIERVRSTHVGGRYLGLHILPYSSRHHRLIKLLLLEDEMGEVSSYVNFLVEVHKSIRHTIDDIIG